MIDGPPPQTKKRPQHDIEFARISEWLKSKGWTAHVSLKGKITIKIKGTEIIINEL